MPACLSLMPMHRPDIPAPTIATEGVRPFSLLANKPSIPYLSWPVSLASGQARASSGTFLLSEEREEFGRSGYGWNELVLVFEEMGRALVCAPFFATVALAANALLTAGTEEARRDYLPGIASGDTIATL